MRMIAMLSSLGNMPAELASYLLQTPDGTRLKLFQANRDGTLMREGETITLHWSPAHSIPVQD